MQLQLLIVLGLYCLMGQLAAYADTWQTIQQRGMLRVAVPKDPPPLGAIDKSLGPRSYDIDIADYICEKRGEALQLIPVTRANLIAYFQTEKVELVIASLGKNKAREAVIDFSQAYTPYYLGVVSHHLHPITNAANLSGKTVGVRRGAVEDLDLSANAPRNIIIRRYEEDNTTFTAWLSGQVAAVVSGHVAIANLTRLDRQTPPLVSFAVQDSPCYIGMRKGQPALKARINSLVRQAKLDGTLNRLSSFWLKTPLNNLNQHEVAA